MFDLGLTGTDEVRQTEIAVQCCTISSVAVYQLEMQKISYGKFCRLHRLQVIAFLYPWSSASIFISAFISSNPFGR